MFSIIKKMYGALHLDDIEKIKQKYPSDVKNYVDDSLRGRIKIRTQTSFCEKKRDVDGQYIYTFDIKVKRREVLGEVYIYLAVFTDVRLLIGEEEIDYLPGCMLNVFRNVYDMKREIPFHILKVGIPYIENKSVRVCAKTPINLCLLSLYYNIYRKTDKDYSNMMIYRIRENNTNTIDIRHPVLGFVSENKINSISIDEKEKVRVNLIKTINNYYVYSFSDKLFDNKKYINFENIRNATINFEDKQSSVRFIYFVNK
jgi:hypothetical protein